MPPSHQSYGKLAAISRHITPDGVTQGLFSCSAFSSADNGVPVYSLGSAYTEVIQSL